MALKQRMTAQQFDEWVGQITDDHMYEYIAGEIVEVPSNAFVSMIAGIIFGELYIFLKGKNLGYLTGADGGYMVAGERYAPDVAFIRLEKQPELAKQGYNPNPPDLAVEVISDPESSQEQQKLRAKISNYLAAETTVWVVDYIQRTVEVHRPGHKLVILSQDDTLTDDDVLPDFKLAVNAIFPEMDEKE